ncbi:MAG TPA: SUMF1/EgtB/PvdO family nonheme iron enzyme [Polyangiaceae bacterium]|jgi:formylglycine-generating enzyme required for sulfatase activity
MSVLLRFVALAVPSVAALTLAVTRSDAQTCNHDCPAGARDAHGCCPAAAHVVVPTVTRPLVTATAIATSGAFVTCPAGFARVPGATFMMGSPAGEGAADEHPQHAVAVGTFCMERLEVTVSQYQACVTAGMCAAVKSDVGCNSNKGPDRLNHPVNCVSYPMAVSYCNWTGARLPTEPEWEYAARGTDGRRYAWGNAAPNAMIMNGCGDECVSYAARIPETKAALFTGNDGFEETAPVGSFPRGASPFGVLDMTGNVFEWTSSPYCNYPAHECTSNYRMYRGGGWYSSAGVTVATRNGNNATETSVVVGIRCAK